MTDLNSTLKKIEGEVGNFVAQSRGEIKTLLDRMDAIEQKNFGAYLGSGNKSGDPAAMIAKAVLEHKSGFESHGRARFDVPSIIQHKTFTSATLVNPQTTPTIGTDGGFRYGNVRALFRVVPAESGSVFQIRETNSTGWNASPQVETTAKNESDAVLTGETLAVQTIAHWVSCSRQALDDVQGLEAFIRGRLLWGLDTEVDEQIVGGNGSGENLKGLTTVAQAFDASLLTPSLGWDMATVVGAAMTQVRIAGYNPDFIIVHPSDAFKMRFTRDEVGQYVSAPLAVRIVESVAINAGSFICGDSTQAVIRARQTATIDMSESHSDYFTRNMVAIRAEERLAFQTMSHKAFVHGNLTTSPA